MNHKAQQKGKDAELWLAIFERMNASERRFAFEFMKGFAPERKALAPQLKLVVSDRSIQPR